MAASEPMKIGVAKRIGSSTVFLLIEILALTDLDHAGRSSVLAPVVGPVLKARIAGSGSFSAAVDLIHVFPARDAKRAADGAKSMLVSVQRSPFEAHVKAPCAVLTPFGFLFQPLDTSKPEAVCFRPAA